MSTFPRLKTGAVAQYPAGRSVTYATDVFRFLDGSEQKYRQLGAAGKRWVVDLQLLDDAELSEISEFFQAQQGRFGTFSFEDPWDGTVHDDCSFADDALMVSLAAEARGALKLVIKEND
jgi:Conserved hypothetical protein 2217 (DUF2460)